MGRLKYMAEYMAGHMKNVAEHLLIRNKDPEPMGYIIKPYGHEPIAPVVFTDVEDAVVDPKAIDRKQWDKLPDEARNALSGQGFDPVIINHDDIAPEDY